MIVYVSKVTAPLRASSRPSTVAPVLAVMEVMASTVPRKIEFVSRVAEVPTCQKTLHARAPPVRTTLLPDPVMRGGCQVYWTSPGCKPLDFACSAFSITVTQGFSPSTIIPAASAGVLPSSPVWGLKKLW